MSVFEGYKLNDNGDIEGALPSIEIHQQVQDAIKLFTENQNEIILDYCAKLNIDPNVLEKQLAEIRLLKSIIRQKDEQIEMMRNCHNCSEWNWKHNKCEKKLKGTCFKNSKWRLYKI